MIISILAGSQSSKSISIRIAKFLKNHLHQILLEDEINIIEANKFEIPMDIATYKNDGSAPEHLKELVDDIYRTDGFILLTPEYNGSYTPVLKN